MCTTTQPNQIFKCLCVITSLGIFISSVAQLNSLSCIHAYKHTRKRARTHKPFELATDELTFVSQASRHNTCSIWFTNTGATGIRSTRTRIATLLSHVVRMNIGKDVKARKRSDKQNEEEEEEEWRNSNIPDLSTILLLLFGFEQSVWVAGEQCVRLLWCDMYSWFTF